MRVRFALAACALVFAAQEPAFAASCGKGMLWPYVRNPGDCLTDAELKAGQSGVYNGTVNSNPDISGIRVEKPVQSTVTATPPAATTPATRAPAAPTPAGATPAAPTSAAPTSAAPTSAANAAPARPVATAPARSLTSISPNGVRNTITSVPRNDVVCHKGALWPFRRQPGDCLTTTERESGQTGVFGGGTGVVEASAVTASATSTASPGPAAAPTVGAPPAATGPAPASADTSTAPPVETCHKGLLWPFVRRAGDCPTSVEKGQRQ